MALNIGPQIPFGMPVFLVSEGRKRVGGYVKEHRKWRWRVRSPGVAAILPFGEVLRANGGLHMTPSTFREVERLIERLNET